MNKKRIKIKRIVGVASLIAISLVLQYVAQFIKISGTSINLSLIPIAVCAIVYGPLSGFLVGLVNGIVVLLDPTTSVFLSTNFVATIFVCILKTGLAGLISGYIFKGLRKVNLPLAIILATIIVPIVNSGIFFVGVCLFFLKLYESEGTSAVSNLIKGILAINFVIEFAINAILSPTIVYLIKILDQRFNLNINPITSKETKEENL